MIIDYAKHIIECFNNFGIPIETIDEHFNIFSEVLMLMHTHQL